MIFHQPHNSFSNYNAAIYGDTVWEPHFHRNFEIIHVLQGGVRCTVNGEGQLLTAGDFGLCLSYEIHSYQPEPDSRYWVGVFSGDYARAFEQQVQNRRGSSFRFRCRPETLQFLQAYLLQPETPPLLLLKACLYAACEEYLRTVTLTRQDSRQSAFIQSVTDFVLEHHRKPVTLSELAAALGYDYHYVSRRFHKVFGMSFPAFLNVYRLEAALELLTQTDKPITEIAFESGFQSVRAFNSSFRSHTGTSPSAYRSQADEARRDKT